MKAILVTVAIMIALTSSAFATITLVRLEGSSIVMEATGAESADLVWQVKEARYANRDTTSGIIFWNRETVSTPSAGLFKINVDLSKAKYGEEYCVTVVNHTDGTMYRLYATISNGMFVAR